LIDVVVLGTFRALTDFGKQTLRDGIKHLGGVFLHTPLLVRRVRETDQVAPGIKFIVIDRNHRLYVFTHPYLFYPAVSQLKFIVPYLKIVFDFLKVMRQMTLYARKF